MREIKSEVFDFVTPRLVLEGTPSDELRQTSNLPQRNYPGWRRMSRFSSLCVLFGFWGNLQLDLKYR
ncbi:hypothetical protein CEXT_271471 [Caerostris extrusa]|uniref:Uncharacterized protein n=1 Tax=Caerostris extrusa TaxID=172846 RepID=A0AAV4SW39_CAEEX|nr:hypothetical protein CEXT_271471 [Caerostris extrusa]